VTEARTSDAAGVSEVAELFQTLVKATRAFQMYPPNNPIYQRASDNLRAAFGPVWRVTGEVKLTVAETDFVWGDAVVYSQPSKSESLAWQLYKDGLRELVLRPGCEHGEMVRFLDTVNRARGDRVHVPRGGARRRHGVRRCGRRRGDAVGGGASGGGA
jgi:hypothetical protein